MGRKGEEKKRGKRKLWNNKLRKFRGKRVNKGQHGGRKGGRKGKRRETLGREKVAEKNRIHYMRRKTIEKKRNECDEVRAKWEEGEGRVRSFNTHGTRGDSGRKKNK